MLAIRLVMLCLGSLCYAKSILADELPLAAPSAWRLTFEDDFDTLNLSRYDTKLPQGGRFNPDDREEQIYVDPLYTDEDSPLRLNPFSVHDGILTIRAERPAPLITGHLHGQHYTSGMLTTYPSFSQLYGYFEIRAKFPLGRGLWPALWLLPTDLSWPPEIDIIEMLGHDPTTIYMTEHSRKRDQIQFMAKVADVTTTFHRYGVLWSKDHLAWYFDGIRSAFTDTPASMHKPMYLLVDLAVGGKWPGHPDKTTAFPADMQITYIRAYAEP